MKFFILYFYLIFLLNPTYCQKVEFDQIIKCNSNYFIDLYYQGTKYTPENELFDLYSFEDTVNNNLEVYLLRNWAFPSLYPDEYFSLSKGNVVLHYKLNNSFFQKDSTYKSDFLNDPNINKFMFILDDNLLPSNTMRFDIDLANLKIEYSKYVMTKNPTRFEYLGSRLYLDTSHKIEWKDILEVKNSMLDEQKE